MSRRVLRDGWLPVLAGLLLAALALTALRVDLLRARYGLGEALREEQALLADERALTVAVRRLRDPARLADLAREQGFARPERVIDLDPGATEPSGARDGRLAALGADAPAGARP